MVGASDLRTLDLQIPLDVCTMLFTSGVYLPQRSRPISFVYNILSEIHRSPTTILDCFFSVSRCQHSRNSFISSSEPLVCMSAEARVGPPGQAHCKATDGNLKKYDTRPKERPPGGHTLSWQKCLTVTKPIHTISTKSCEHFQGAT